MLVTEELTINCLAVTLPLTDKLPAIFVSVLTVKPPFGDIDAETLPDVICDRFNPVTPLAGTLDN